MGDQRTLGAREVLAAAREEADALGWRWDGLVGLRRAGEVWTVTVDVVETRRVPPTMDILAVYEMEIDRAGEVLGWRRRRHHVRGQGSG
ncbi:gas vesicle protein GvpO [Actinomycetospora sp. CA-101289]|uniref:gas vesicle protein GvpO n=1 Tax=Actinomycetospora sp. CA-101289 TaxID=3239893 RepID=UPI003D994A7D